MDISLVQRRELLIDLVEEWNANRLDLFEISHPDENLEYHGVMRFLFQDSGAKLATKCIRVSSTANTQNVIETLVEKFRPDMKMLTTPIYHLYEVDSNGAERRLELSEYPLEVQLNWTKDEKEGKFVLRNAAHKPINVQKADKNESSFKRKLSKREKKEQKKRQERSGDDDKENAEEPSGVFVRTKSNSEAVMRRRRELKVQKKLDEIQKEGDHGGLLKVHGDSLNPDVPYKSLLLSVTDPASFVVEEMLDKYGMSKKLAHEYCLVQVFNAHAGEIGGGLRPQEHVLEDGECPLAILHVQVNRGNVTFHVRRRDGKRMATEDKGIPFLLELNLDGTDIQRPKKHLLHINLTQVGSIAQPSSGQHLRMIGPTILPHHAVIANIEGVVTVTPNSAEAECYVEGKRIYQTTVLQHGKVVRFGHHHAFRFSDPAVEEILRKNMPEGMMDEAMGDNGPPGYSPRMDDVLPAGLEFRDEGEDNFLHSVVSDVTEGICQFKLAPCYALYLAARYRIDRVQPGMPMEEHFRKLLAFCNKLSFMIRDCVHRYRSSPQELAFWMANMSELLHFFKMDKELQKHTQPAQDVLADTVQDAFKDLVYIMQGDLYQSMPAFLSDNDNSDAERLLAEQGKPSIGEVLHVLSSAMSLLRRCRVNAALTIQLFSQLFHFINMWLFNKLVMEPQLRLITRQWGVRLKRRLSRVEVWAEKQGLELAADCHLCRISQAAHLLQAPKHSPDDIASISSTCFKLNSLQLRVLLEQYHPEPGEMQKVPQDVIESVVSVARNTADDLTRSEGREVSVEEEADLQLPFLLPEDGYSSDIVKGIPQGLADFLEPVMADGLCRLTPLPSQSGSWQVFMMDLDELGSQQDEQMGLVSSTPPLPPNMDGDGPNTLPPEPENLYIQLNKVNGSMGLSIVAAKGESQADKGIYIKSVVNGGAAALDGRLKAGDQLLKVDGKSLIGLTQERAAELMKETGQVVDLHVVKQGAFYQGLATLLNQPTPPMSRAPPPQDNPEYMMQHKPASMMNDEGYNKKGQFGMGHPEDMKSKSQGNLLREDDERMRWQQRGISPPNDSRAMSQPDLGADPDSPNYQNYPGESQPLRPMSQFRDAGPPPISSAGPMANRPRSEFVDPNWYPPPPVDDRQPIYQNQMIGKPNRLPNSRELPSPPINERPPPVPPHPSEEDQAGFPPPPSNDYVNYQMGGPRAPNPQHSHQNSRDRVDNTADPRIPKPDPVPPEPSKVATDPPPWARGPQRGPAPSTNGLSSPKSPTQPPLIRPAGVPPSQRPLQPGDLIRSAPIIQPYQPQPPPPGEGYRAPAPGRGPGSEPFRAPGPRQPMRPGAPHAAGSQPYNGPPSQPMRGQRPPITQQMIQSQINKPWEKEADGRRMPDDRLQQREDTIRELESKPYRSPDEEDRLRRLRLDSEFDKRAEQVRKESEKDSDEDQSGGRPYPGGSMPNRGYQPPFSHQSSVTMPNQPPAMAHQPPNMPYQQPHAMAHQPPYQNLPVSTHQPTSMANLPPSTAYQPPIPSSQPPGMAYPPPGMANQPPSMANQQSLRRAGLPQGATGAPEAVKRDLLQSKTVTFKPAYRGEDTLRPSDFAKHTIKPGPPEDNRMNPQQQDLLRQQRELREKQRRETQDNRRSYHQQEDDEMKRRREHDLSLRKEAERIQNQHINDTQNRYGGPPPGQRRSPAPQRAYPPPETNERFNPGNGYRPDVDPTRGPVPQNNRIPQQYNNKPPSPSVSQYSQQSYNEPPHSAGGYIPPVASNYNTSFNSAPPMLRQHSHNSMNASMDYDMPTGHTPGVIGAQEVYRDPRSRREAQQQAHRERGGPGDRLSFRDKMRLFDGEGESQPSQRPKSSKSQRALEESLSYDNGNM
ncbi:afadin-like isoform X2 [Watersipora subatra]|uniref:afadin-like isoform X2 n=1 Tax=Watersipora subatra TaxID=2589382 RepID=UPI00355B4065